MEKKERFIVKGRQMKKLNLPKDQCDAIFNQKYCDIDYEFMGFLDVYESLSKIVPKYWSIVDLGCAYAPQCFYFEKHKEYVGVDVSGCLKFKAGNTKHFRMPIEKFIKEHSSEFNMDETFAICSYVGDQSMKIVRQTFKNVFTYYPHGMSLGESKKIGIMIKKIKKIKDKNAK